MIGEQGAFLHCILMEMEEPATMLDNEPDNIFPLEKNSIIFFRGPCANMVVASVATSQRLPTYFLPSSTEFKSFLIPEMKYTKAHKGFTYYQQT